MFMIIKPADGNDAQSGNGTMTAFDVGSNDRVDALYAKAISLGAPTKASGSPWGIILWRLLRDLDGNKHAFFNS